MLDETPRSLLVECHRALFGLCFQRLDLIKVLFHACKFTKDGVLFRIDAMQSEISWDNVSKISVFNHRDTYRK